MEPVAVLLGRRNTLIRRSNKVGGVARELRALKGGKLHDLFLASYSVAAIGKKNTFFHIPTTN